MSLLQILKDRPEDLLLPNDDIQEDTLQNLKLSLDKVAPVYSPLDAVHVSGLKTDQIWVQAKMVLDGFAEKLSAKLSEYTRTDDSGSEHSDADDAELDDAGSDGAEVDSELDDSESHAESDDAELDDAQLDDAVLGETQLNDSNEVHENPVKLDQSGSADNDNHENLNRDDFDLAEFQQQVLQLERDGSESEEEVDFNADIDVSSDDCMHYEDFFGSAPKRIKFENKKSKVSFADDPENSKEDVDGVDDDDTAEPDILELTRKDLFDNDDSDSQTAENLSKFEKQQRDLARQIEQLEAENIGEKSWEMRGEVKARDRQEDSLFQLQFDRNNKSAPLITEEATNSIEEIIKERIKKQQFDDLLRRTELAAPTLKPELPQLSEQKSEKSLAELYEDEQMRASNPEYFAKQDSAAMDAVHKEIADLFTSVSRKLDALCSWSYTPKTPVSSLQIVTDAPSISIEEAQPGTLAPQDQLAPQEVYRGEAAIPMDNSEMSTSLKRKKRREKSKAKSKSASKKTDAQNTTQSKRTSKEHMFNTLKRGNVTLIDKRGHKRDMRGDTVKDNQALQSGSFVKL